MLLCLIFFILFFLDIYIFFFLKKKLFFNFSNHTYTRLKELMMEMRKIQEKIISNLHMSHGESVVYIVAPAYARAGRRPELYSAAVSPW